MARDSEESKAVRPRRGRRHWRRWVLLFVLVLGTITWLLPAVIAHTPLRHQLVPLVLPGLNGTASIGGATLGWLDAVELRDLDLRDAKGAEVLLVPLVRTETPLWRLVLGSSNLGKVRIERLDLNLVLRCDGSNLEDVLRPVLHPPSSTPSGNAQPPGFTLEVVDSRVQISEASPGPAAGGAAVRPTGGAIDKIQATVCHAPGTDAPLTATLDCRVTPSGSSAPAAPLHGELKLKTDPATGRLAADRGRLALKGTAVELGTLGPLLLRLTAPMTLQGATTMDLALDWNRDPQGPTVSMLGTADAQQVTLAAPLWLGTDTLRLDHARATPNISFAGGKLQLKSCRLESDFGAVEASGSFDPAALEGTADVATALTRLEAQDLELTGQLDLARLAERLPDLLRLKSDTRIESGQLALSFHAREQDGRRRCDASLTASNLAATAAGRRIEYRQPVRLDLVGEVPPGGEPSTQFRCTSDYLTAEAEGTPSAATLSIDANLDRLAADLGQLVDLGNLRLAGHIGGGFQFRRQRAGGATAAGQPSLAADGHVLLENFQFQAPGTLPWQEPRLMLAVKVRGAADASKITRVDEASVTIDSGGDHLSATLRQPVAAPTAATPWPVDMTVKGDVATWLARLQPWVPVSGWQATGAMQATSSATVSFNRLQVEKASAEVQSLTATNGSLTIDEPRVELQGAVDLDLAASRFSVPTLSLASSSVSLRADKFVWQAGSAGRQAGGQVALRGDLSRISQWFAPRGSAPPIQLTGIVQGQAELAQSGAAVSVTAAAEADNFVASVEGPPSERMASPVALPAAGAPTWQPIWSEPKISLSGAASYHAAEDQLQLDRFEIASNALRLANLHGRITDLGGRRRVELSGEVNYDLARITPLLWPYVGQGIKLVGQGTRDFSISGPLVPAVASASAWPVELTAQAAVGFDRVELYGMTTSAGELKAELKQQVVQFAPLDLTVSQGRVTIAPQIELAPVVLLVHRPQRVLQQVELTPALCQSWMKFVAPLLANATQVQGRFSMDLSRCRVPLSDMNHCDVAGTLTLHSGSVRPGPMAEGLVGIASQFGNLINGQLLGGVLGTGPAGATDGLKLNIESQDVQFQVHDGRVTHSGLKIVVGDVEIRTHGSVGFDQTVEIVAEIPILPQWSQRWPGLKGLAGQTVQIPIRGTLARPTMDRRALDNLLRQVGASAVGGAVQGALQKGLDGLLNPKKQ